jgi:hypothetical protein
MVRGVAFSGRRDIPSMSAMVISTRRCGLRSLYPGKRTSFHSRRQLFANASIAASRVAAG